MSVEACSSGKRRAYVGFKRAARKAAAVMLLLGVAPGAASAECRIAALGDSLTAGYGLPEAQGFTAVLEDALREQGYACTVINAGVSGDTTAGGLARLEWVLADRPTHVLVELGANDGLRAVPPETTGANLEAIVERLRADDLPVLLTGMLAPPNLGADYGDAFARVFEEAAAAEGVAFYPFFLEGVAAEPALNQPDGLHPNARGVDVIVERLLPTVTEWLEASGVAPAAGGADPS